MSKLISKQSNTIEVIGAGYGRTGTSSLKKALEILGYNDTYHMSEVVWGGRSHSNFWLKVSEKKEPMDFDEVYCDKKTGKPVYRATCDLPAALYWQEQLEEYPDAKVILTVRDPEKWYTSCMETIFHAIHGSPHQYWGLYLLDTLRLNYFVNRDFWLKTISRDAFRGQWDKQSVITTYNDHNEKVKRECPKEKLLVFSVEEGWGPLCEFLDKPIPAEPFPRVNDTNEWKRLFGMLNVVGYAVALDVVVLMPLGIGYLAWKKWSK